MLSTLILLVAKKTGLSGFAVKAIGAGLIALMAWGALASYNAALRKQGRVELSNELKKQDSKTLKEKAVRDEKIRNETDDDLLNRFPN